MKLIEIMIQKRKAEYESQQPYSSGHLAPRKGFYLIKGMVRKPLGSFPFNYIPVGICLWSPDGKHFLEGSELDVQLFSLYQAGSNGPKHIAVEELTNKVIEIKGHGFVSQIDQAFKHSLVLTWEISTRKIPVNNATKLSLQSMIPQGQKLGAQKFQFVEDPSDFQDSTDFQEDQNYWDY